MTVEDKKNLFMSLARFMHDEWDNLCNEECSKLAEVNLIIAMNIKEVG